jgi:5-methyltetrahydrofolate--homocysteine methyltransferase
MAAVLPLAKRYGAAVVALALDGEGVPASLEGRLLVLERIRAAAAACGLSDSDLLVDMLTLTAAADPLAPELSLEAVRAVSDKGLATVLGVSNVSHGLPQRSVLNAAFVRAALAAGLSAAIANPNEQDILKAVQDHNEPADGLSYEQGLELWQAAYEQSMKLAAAGVFENIASAQSAGRGAKGAAGDAATALLDAGAGDAATAPLDAGAGGTARSLEAQGRLRVAILRGDTDQVPALIADVIDAGCKPEMIVDTVLAPTMQQLGDDFANGKAFLPQMMIAANAMKTAVAVIKEGLPQTDAANVHGTVVFCSVQGDVHSIGKDICVALLESQDFAVIDLGVDVEPQAILAAALAHEADVICLSALMTTTLASMQATIDYIYERAPAYRDDPRKAVLVGGAVVSGKWAEQAGAGYASDAPRCVELVREIILAGKRRP